MNDLEQLAAQPLTGYSPSLAMMLWQLEESRSRTLKWLGGVNPRLLDWSPPGERVNTVGTLLYHIGLIEFDWVFVDILERTYPPEFEQIYSIPVREPDGWLSSVAGVTMDAHLERLARTRQAVLDALRGISEEDFSRPRTLPTYSVTPAWALNHLLQHEAEHRAEMAMVLSRAGVGT